MTRKMNPPQIVVTSFLLAIIVGAILLSLPIATRSGERLSFEDSLFTATSATCVTGLIVKDTGTYFSWFGKSIILVLVQMGGLGIMTFSTLFAIFLGRKLTIKEDLVIQRTMVQNSVKNLGVLIKYIIFITIGAEVVGAIFLGLRWANITSWSPTEIVINSIFHSISAFCNAGFSLFPKSFTTFLGDTWINFTMVFLIIIGGIGFIVIMEIPKIFRKKHFCHISIQSKVAITVSVVLIMVGVVSFFFLEKHNTLSGFSLKEGILSSFFQSVSARTAGFNTIKIGSLATPTLFILIFLII